MKGNVVLWEAKGMGRGGGGEEIRLSPASAAPLAIQGRGWAAVKPLPGGGRGEERAQMVSPTSSSSSAAAAGASPSTTSMALDWEDTVLRARSSFATLSASSSAREGYERFLYELLPAPAREAVLLSRPSAASAASAASSSTPPRSFSPATSRFHASWHSWMMFMAYSLFMKRSPRPKVFSGLPSGTLYVRNHSRIVSSVPGSSASTSSMSLRSSAHLSSLSMTTTFQSVSPSSIMQSTPRTFTRRTTPVGMMRSPISHTSSGSLSPPQPVSG
mmetsp:Transcript_8101/g.27566  ORF Transcript_8101/g.27566 Transcript_8101/m.27566 type:complete len:273 (+) Transcript_8101:80-898(+)